MLQAGLLSACALLAQASQITAVTPLQSTAAASAAAPAFTYDSHSFLLHGEPYVIIGGQMDPQRIPPEYWRDRLAKARAMGLNTIFSYVYWNLLEPRQGDWRGGQGAGDITAYFRLAQEEGLHVVLRPGPYICGERDWGGFPSWLSTVPGLEVRDFNEPFLNLSKGYLERLASDLQPLQVTEGGPILMVQVENEYGSYGTNHNYTRAVRDILRVLFDVPLYTNDGGVNWTLAGGQVPGVLAAVDGSPVGAFEAREEYITDPSELGPLLDGEYYTYAPDTWGSENPHNSVADNPDQVAQFVSDLDYVLGANNSISLYMFHGGTNFALSNGAIWKNYSSVFTTSYDYGAPLGEDGRATALYFTLRDTIQKYVPAGTIPDPPTNLPLLSIPEITLTPKLSLFDPTVLRGSQHSTTGDAPVTMEELGQDYGFVFYEHDVTQHASGLLRPGDRARDRVLVYVNGARAGVIDSTYAHPNNVSVRLRPGDRLGLLVENLGRVDYWSLESDVYDALRDPYKGIVGAVTVGNSTLRGWTSTSLPLDSVPALSSRATTTTTTTTGHPETPMWYSGTFTLGSNNNRNYTEAAARDTFVAIANGVKGVVWVNGFNLGRYWVVGPQQSLYLPGTVLKAGGQANEITVLELEPGNQTISARGEAGRAWGNNPDPDRDD